MIYLSYLFIKNFNLGDKFPKISILHKTKTKSDN